MKQAGGWLAISFFIFNSDFIIFGHIPGRLKPAVALPISVFEISLA